MKTALVRNAFVGSLILALAFLALPAYAQDAAPNTLHFYVNGQVEDTAVNAGTKVDFSAGRFGKDASIYIVAGLPMGHALDPTNIVLLGYGDVSRFQTLDRTIALPPDFPSELIFAMRAYALTTTGDLFASPVIMVKTRAPGEA